MGTMLNIKEIHLYGTGTLRRGLIKCDHCNEWLWHLEERGLTGCPGCGFVKADTYEISEEEYNTARWYFKEIYPMIDRIDRDTQRHSKRKAFGM